MTNGSAAHIAAGTVECSRIPEKLIISATLTSRHATDASGTLILHPDENVRDSTTRWNGRYRLYVQTAQLPLSC